MVVVAAVKVLVIDVAVVAAASAWQQSCLLLS